MDNKQYSRISVFFLSLILPLLFATVALAQVPRPSDVFGFKLGSDYKLAGYGQLLNYYKKLDAASNRVKLGNIGKTTLGRPMILLSISSKKNLVQLDRWRTISAKIERVHIDSAAARKLSAEGGGMHASEMAHGHSGVPRSDGGNPGDAAYLQKCVINH